MEKIVLKQESCKSCCYCKDSCPKKAIVMSDYINSMIRAGFQIKELLEPFPPNSWRKDNPKKYYGFINTPTYAIFKIEKII